MSPKLSVAVICLRVAGKLFHRRGPATVKLLSPKVVRVRGTVSDRYEDERRWRQDECLQTGTSAPLKPAIGVQDTQS